MSGGRDPLPPTVSLDQNGLLDKVMEEMQRDPERSIADVIEGLAGVEPTYTDLVSLARYGKHTCYVVCLACSNSFLFSAAWDGTIKVWSLALPDLVYVTDITEHGKGRCNNMWTLCCSPADQLLYSGDQTGVIKIWSLNNLLEHKNYVNRLQRSVEGHSKDVMDIVCFDKWIISGSLDGDVKIWDRRDLSPVTVMSQMHEKEGNAQVWKLAVDAASEMLFAGGCPEWVYQWSLKDFSVVRTFEVPNTKGGTRTLSCSLGHLFCGHWSGEMSIWDISTGVQICREKVDTAVHTISHFGHMVVVGGRAGQVSVYTWQEGMTPVVQSHTTGEWVNASVVVGRCILVGTGDNCIEVWGLQTPSTILNAAHQEATLTNGWFRCSGCPSHTVCDGCEMLTVAYYSEGCTDDARADIQQARAQIRLPRVQTLLNDLFLKYGTTPEAEMAEKSEFVLTSAAETLQWCTAQVEAALARTRALTGGSILPFVANRPTTGRKSPMATGLAGRSGSLYCRVPPKLSDGLAEAKSLAFATPLEAYPQDYVPEQTVEEMLCAVPDHLIPKRFIDRLIRTATRFCKAKASSLPFEQRYALFAYTYHIYDDDQEDDTTHDANKQRNSYKVQINILLNCALRNQDMVGITLWRPLIYQLDHALDGLPPYSGLIYRSMPSSPSEDIYHLGNDITWQAYSSCTESRALACGSTGVTTAVVLFIITPWKAKAIGPYSWRPMEQEVLFPRGSALRVVSISSEATRDLLGLKCQVIELMELDTLSNYLMP